MITAWVLYWDPTSELFLFEERDGVNFSSIDPADWALSPGIEIILVFQKASFLAAWLDGEPVAK